MFCMTDDNYFTVRLKKEFYGEKIDKFMKENPGYNSRADALRDIIRRYFENHNFK